MYRAGCIFLNVLFLAPFMMRASVGVPASALNDVPLAQQEKRLATIDDELSHLSQYGLRSGVGSIGYRSQFYPDPDHLEWVQVNLRQDTPIDQIVLVPTIWRDTAKGVKNDGFPETFRVIVGKNGDTLGTTIASYTAADHILPRIAPLVMACPGTTASWVRIEATRLTAQAQQDTTFALQLSEILVFNGQENVALHQKVSTSYNRNISAHTWAERFLVDGFVPYQMNAVRGERSRAAIYNLDPDENLVLTLDLGEIQTLTGINLHTVEQSDTVPQSSFGDFALPQRIRLEGAAEADFSDARLLLDHHWETIYEKGPIIMMQFEAASCRYVRLTAIGPYLSDYGDRQRYRIGFAEIELNSFGVNLAIGKEFRSNNSPASVGRPSVALTDGRNLFGRILPVRDWLGELAKRHELERERPLVAAAVQQRYEQQKTNLNRMVWLATVLGAGIAFTILIDRMLRMRAVAGIRERFAADLHDELGANIHTIGLLGDVALKVMNDPERLKFALQSTRELTERTGAAVRHCINLQEADGLYGNLPEDMRRAASRILSDHQYTLSIKGEEYLEKLKPLDRTDLLLFYKESLINIIRHADATGCSTQLIADNKYVVLTVTDNGRGFSASQSDKPPLSLARRAHLLGAQIAVQSPAGGGTCIKLTLRHRRMRLLR